MCIVSKRGFLSPIRSPAQIPKRTFCVIREKGGGRPNLLGLGFIRSSVNSPIDRWAIVQYLAPFAVSRRSHTRPDVSCVVLGKFLETMGKTTKFRAIYILRNFAGILPQFLLHTELATRRSAEQSTPLIRANGTTCGNRPSRQEKEPKTAPPKTHA